MVLRSDRSHRDCKDAVQLLHVITMPDQALESNLTQARGAISIATDVAYCNTV